MQGSQIMTIIAGIRLLIDASAGVDIPFQYVVGSITWYILFGIFIASEIIVLLAQLIGGWQGFKAFQEMQLLQAGGADMTGASGGRDGGWGGGQAVGGGGGGGGQYRPSGGVVVDGNASGGQARQPDFQAFAGAGTRLGS